MKRQYNINDEFFDIIDSEAKAYLLGFFVADGYFNLNARCTKSYKFQVALQDCDREIIEMYQRYICPDTPITTTHYTNGAKDRKPVNSIRWTSGHMAETLINKYKVVPNKTKDLNFIFPFETIPEEFIWDFIRGFFDGDGQISYNEDTHATTFALYATSESWSHQIGDLFERNFNVKKRVEGIKKSFMILYTIRFFAFFKKQEFIKSLCEKLYKNKTLFLTRKRNKFKEYLMFKYRANQTDIERLFDSVERS